MLKFVGDGSFDFVLEFGFLGYFGAGYEIVSPKAVLKLWCRNEEFPLVRVYPTLFITYCKAELYLNVFLISHSSSCAFLLCGMAKFLILSDLEFI